MVKKRLIKWFAIGFICLAILAAIVGGYFGMSKENAFYKYYRSPITADSDGFISAYLSAQYAGAKAIIAPGFTHKAPICELFNKKHNQVKDLGFLLLDEAMSASDKAATNTWSITFRSDLGSIRTGIALAQFLNDYANVFDTDGKDGDKDHLTFGMYGGLPFSSVTSFMGGMQIGIEWYNQNVVPSDKNLQAIKIIEPKGLTNNFSGGFGPGDGDSIINTYLQENDLDAFMPVAGPQIWSAQRKIIELNKKTILIGVDSACENDPQNKSLPFKNQSNEIIGNGKYVQFSSEKKLNDAVYKALSIINNGNKLPDGEDATTSYNQFVDANGNGGFGTNAVGNITNGCVNVSQDGDAFFQKALNGKNDPSLDAKYSEQVNMKYVYAGQEYFYGNPNEGGLQQEFLNLIANEQKLDLSNFIRKNNEKDEDKIKIILSSPTSVLFDGSFSESAYNGLYNFMKSLGINIPQRKSKNG